MFVLSVKETQMQRITIVMMALLMAALAGCNTVQGIGKDVERAGEAIQKSTR
jgi:entericidin B